MNCLVCSGKLEWRSAAPGLRGPVVDTGSDRVGRLPAYAFAAMADDWTRWSRHKHAFP